MLTGFVHVSDDNVVFCRLSDLQEQVYQFILKHPGLVHVMSMDDPCHCSSGEPRKYCCKVSVN